jgi:hypothetical protein
VEHRSVAAAQPSGAQSLMWVVHLSDVHAWDHDQPNKKGAQVARSASSEPNLLKTYRFENWKLFKLLFLFRYFDRKKSVNDM